MTTYAIWDIGGTGAKADACAIWIAQFIGREIRVLDYYEAVGPAARRPTSNWLRSHGYGRPLCVLPHDGGDEGQGLATSPTRARCGTPASRSG
jgi:phage terminase large subunit